MEDKELELSELENINGGLIVQGESWEGFWVVEQQSLQIQICRLCCRETRIRETRYQNGKGLSRVESGPADSDQRRPGMAAGEGFYPGRPGGGA